MYEPALINLKIYFRVFEVGMDEDHTEFRIHHAKK
jgi:hypothetical protein